MKEEKMFSFFFYKRRKQFSRFIGSQWKRVKVVSAGLLTETVIWLWIGIRHVVYIWERESLWFSILLERGHHREHSLFVQKHLSAVITHLISNETVDERVREHVVHKEHILWCHLWCAGLSAPTLSLDEDWGRGTLSQTPLTATATAMALFQRYSGETRGMETGTETERFREAVLHYSKT